MLAPAPSRPRRISRTQIRQRAGKRGNSSDYTLARLRRDRPDLAEHYRRFRGDPGLGALRVIDGTATPDAVTEALIAAVADAGL